MKKELILVGMFLVLFITACTTVPTSDMLSDQQPVICSDWDKAQIINIARQAYIDAHPNPNASNWEYNPAAGFVEPTGADIVTHILIYNAEDNTLYRNQSFTIRLSGAVSGTNHVTTTEAKGTFTSRHDFDKLNELTITVTPITNASYLPTPLTFKKFVPCQSTPWVISVPYSMKINTSRTTEESLSVPKINVKNNDDKTIDSAHPVYIAPGDVLSFKVKDIMGGSDKVLTYEFNRQQIIKIELYDPDGKLIPTTIKPQNATLRRLGDYQAALGPLTATGDYKIVIFAASVQPADPITLILMKGEEVEKASDIFFATKSTQVQGYVTDNRLTLAAAILFIAAALLMMKGGKKK